MRRWLELLCKDPWEDRSEEITGEDDNFFELLSIGGELYCRRGDIVEPALRGGLKE